MNTTLVRFWLCMIGAAAGLELFDFMFAARAMPDQAIVALNIFSLLLWGLTRRPRSRPRAQSPLPG
jgi:hypothetical protein